MALLLLHTNCPVIMSSPNKYSTPTTKGTPTYEVSTDMARLYDFSAESIVEQKKRTPIRFQEIIRGITAKAKSWGSNSECLLKNVQLIWSPSQQKEKESLWHWHVGFPSRFAMEKELSLLWIFFIFFIPGAEPRVIKVRVRKIFLSRALAVRKDRPKDPVK